MTPTRPTRPGPSGISASFVLVGFIGFDRGDDRLNRNPPVGDQLATRAPRGRRERCCPQVLPDEHTRGASRVHGGREVRDVLLREELRKLTLERLKLAELLEVGKLHRLDGTILV